MCAYCPQRIDEREGQQSESLTSGSPTQRPNIVFILTDDLDARSIARLQKLNLLLTDRGTTFANFFEGGDWAGTERMQRARAPNAERATTTPLMRNSLIASAPR